MVLPCLVFKIMKLQYTIMVLPLSFLSISKFRDLRYGVSSFEQRKLIGSRGIRADKTFLVAKAILRVDHFGQLNLLY